MMPKLNKNKTLRELFHDGWELPNPSVPNWAKSQLPWAWRRWAGRMRRCVSCHF
jgi:hypothetical protein